VRLDDSADKACQRIENYLAAQRPTVPRTPEGSLRRPFVDPASVYRGQLWDWDAYFTLVALAPYLEDYSLVRDCVLNFLDHQRADGSIPFVISTEFSGPLCRTEGSYLNSAKPVLAQMALLAGDESADWRTSALPGLRRHLEHWEETQRHSSGLFRWRSHRGSGADNHPGVYGRPLDATAGVDLNCLMVAEYRAIAQLHSRAGEHDRAAGYAASAEDLADTVRRRLWDPVMKDFCHADTLTRTPPGVRQDADWLVPLRFRSWVGFYALWAGVATAEQAEAMVAACDLICDFGIRTLSRDEPLYNVAATANPSNWQGPVWMISNYIAFTGLLNYGYDAQAARILTGTLDLLAGDLERIGVLHEYYDPDTGEGITGDGFLGWNLLATAMYRAYTAVSE
jgi:putative isomerase